MMPKNILFTSWYTGLGGGETDLLSLAQFLDPQDWIPHLLLPADGVLAQKWREHSWQVHITPYRGASTFFVPLIWAKFPVVNRMQSILTQNKIDFIASEYHTLPMIHAAAKLTNIPIMWTVHGWWFKPKFWQGNFFRQIPIVARSKSIRDGFLGTPPFLPKDDVPVIYSGVDTNRFRPNPDAKKRELAQLGLDENSQLVVMVARFQEVKGHHIFQEMARLISAQIDNVHFVVAGEDTFGVSKDEAYRQTMLEQAQSDPILRERLHYIGFRDDVENILAAADVVVCASIFESYGKVNLEAMSCGTPVVSTNQGGPSETILDGKTGYLVPPNDPAKLASKVIELLNDSEKRAEFGQLARDHVQNTFSAEASTQSYTTFFQKLLN